MHGMVEFQLPNVTNSKFNYHVLPKKVQRSCVDQVKKDANGNASTRKILWCHTFYKNNVENC